MSSSILVRSNEPTPAAPEKTAAAEQGSGDQTAAPEAKTPEQKESTSGSVTEDKDAVESETAESKETESEEETKSKEETADGKAKKNGGFQRRIDKLNQRISTEAQEKEYWRQLALKNAGDPNAQKKVDTAPVASTEGKPDPGKFETHAEYVEALTDWKVDQKEKQKEQKKAQTDAQSEQQKQFKAHQDRVKAFADKNDDFDEQLAKLADVPRSVALDTVIFQSDKGPDILYELAKNPAEAKRIAMLPPLVLARELGKIEARLTTAVSTETKETKTITSAAKPLTPVGGKGAAPKTIYDRNLSQSEYERLRNEQIKKRRQA